MIAVFTERAHQLAVVRTPDSERGVFFRASLVRALHSIPLRIEIVFHGAI